MERRNAIISRSNGNRDQQNLARRVRRQTGATINFERAAFNYDSTIDYSVERSVAIGPMSVVCQHCKAYKFSSETPGMCCASGKVKLPALNPPPEPLRSLLSGTGRESSHFLTNIQKYNCCFQMTSFGATNIIRDNFMSTFKVISAHSATHGNFNRALRSDFEQLSRVFMMSAIEFCRPNKRDKWFVMKSSSGSETSGKLCQQIFTDEMMSMCAKMRMTSAEYDLGRR